MSEFHVVAKVGDIPAGEGRAYHIENRMVGVYFVDGKYTAIDDICPHMGASLVDGYIEAGAVYCPWHAWKFNICDGTWMDNPRAKIRLETFEVRVEGDEIQVRVVPAPSKVTDPGSSPAANP